MDRRDPTQPAQGIAVVVALAISTSMSLSVFAAAGCSGPRMSSAAPSSDVPATMTDKSTLVLADARASGAALGVGPTATGIAGNWYLNAAGQRVRLNVDCTFDGATCTADVYDETALRHDAADALRWDPAQGTLSFTQTGPGFRNWWRLRIAEGVLTGRTATVDDPDTYLTATEPTDPAAFVSHVTGWKAQYFDAALFPRVYDLIVDGDVLVHLRLDRVPSLPGQFEGRFKPYATISERASSEQDERDASVERWDGTNLDFTVRDPDFAWTCKAGVDGRTIAGSCIDSDTGLAHAFTGSRVEVLGHGFSGKAPMARSDWQARIRRQLAHLMMADNPAPTSVTVTDLSGTLAPLPSQSVAPDRDDGDLSLYPQSYQLRELQFDYTLPDPSGISPSLSRRVHGYLAVPSGPAPVGGYPAVVALNGHDGSGFDSMNPDSLYYWYGDSFARRGYVVLALDIGHRPVADRHGLYGGYVYGDDPEHANGPHAAIQADGMDSDWEEDGERTWDAMRAVDYLSALPSVNSKRIMVAGHSMGGEITTFAAAFDTRLSMAVAAGFSPDFGVLAYHGSHGCWQWRNADLREYIDASDLETMVAPRPLVVETGIQDWTYSWLTQPFAGDKQVLRRTRAEYADAPDSLVHYLHDDLHRFHVGDGDPLGIGQSDVRAPAQVAPETPWAVGWQRDPNTWGTGESLFDLIARLVAAN